MWQYDIVVAADSKWGIGKDNKLPWPMLKPDMAHFKSLTVGQGENAVIMGRKTWESLPDKFRPLPNRKNIVLTRQADYPVPDGVLKFRSLVQVMNELSVAGDVFIIGGGEVYERALSLGVSHGWLRNIYLTKINHEYECDTFLPELNNFSVLERTVHQYDPPFEIMKLGR